MHPHPVIAGLTLRFASFATTPYLTISIDLQVVLRRHTAQGQQEQITEGNCLLGVFPLAHLEDLKVCIVQNLSF